MKQMLALAVMAAGLALGGRAWAEGLPKEDGTWTELAPMPTARHDFDIMVVGGKIYAVAGACEETMNVLEVYDPAGNTWSAAAAVPWPTAYYAGGVLDGRIYCAGGMMRTQVGEKQTTQAQANLSIYDTKTNQWTAGPPLSGPRSGLKGVVHGGKLYAIGGIGNEEGKRVEVYDPRSGQWSLGVPLPSDRMAPGVAAVGDRIYVIGGSSREQKGEQGSVWIYDTKSGEWSQGAPMPTKRRDLFVAVLGERIYCMGGVALGGGYLNVVEVYDTAKNSWSTATPLPEPKAWAGACALDGKIYVAGGANREPGAKGYHWIKSLYVYTPGKR